MGDQELLGEIRDVLATSPFVGEGHRKVWARLRRRGVRTSRKRVLRLTRGAGLLAPTAKVRKRAQRLHDGTITVTEPDTLWATDATEGWSEEGRCAVFVMIDHASGEAWADAGLRMDRFAAADLLREVTTERFGSVEQAVAAGLALRYDGGPCFRSAHYQTEIDSQVVWSGVTARRVFTRLVVRVSPFLVRPGPRGPGRAILRRGSAGRPAIRRFARSASRR